MSPTLSPTLDAAAPADHAGDPALDMDVYRFREFARLGYPFSAVSHALLIPFFYVIGQTVMWQYNLLSVAVIAVAWAFHLRGWIRAGLFLLFLEFLAYTLLGTLMLGWESGVFLFYLSPVLIVFFAPFLSPWGKMKVVGLVCVLVLVSMALTNRFGVLSPMDPALASWFLVANLFVEIAGVAACFLSLANAIRDAEDRLRAANGRLARFSDAVSEYLDPMLVGSLRDGGDVAPRLCFITVFFADLAGSTRISMAMDEAAFGDMLGAFVAEMQAIVKTHRGYLEDISGDGIFGYVGNFDSRGPAADAADAVAMAVAMQARLAELSVDFRARYGLPEPLHMRIGINSGEALVGKTSGARAIYTANGDIVNLGAKLEKKLKDLSDTGGVLLGPRTADLVAGRFDLTAHAVTVEGAEMTVCTVG
ncbi:MAG: adenylate/guanylate cyclase domain-containing protein [Hyphomicrobiales bacterium]|nr:adenylate/guanylate cyclase domain-containing protein [Hyphomicrobiales bacterium]